MKSRAALLAGAFALIISLSNILTISTNGSNYSESFPAMVCPPIGKGEISYVSLNSKQTQVRKTGISAMTYKSSQSTRPQGTNQALVVDSQEITPITWMAQQNVWAGAQTCLAPISSQWLVGATADVTSKGVLTLVNSGLGKALVSVDIFTENGVQAEQQVQLKANSIDRITLASLVPGATSIALHITAQTGRVSAFLTDIRGRGLRSLGGDVVNPSAEASKSLIIPAIPHLVVRGKALPHSLRILVPGDVDAHISAVIYSTDGTFAPAGLDGRTISAGRVIDIPLNVVMKTGKFALGITSDRPIVASVNSRTTALGKTDFVWSTSTSELIPSAYAVTGLNPTLVFTSEKVSVGLDLTTTKGKIRHIDLRGEGIATYVVPDGIKVVRITSVSSKTYGAALIATKSGYGFAPLVPGSALTRYSVPHANIRVLVP